MSTLNAPDGLAGRVVWRRPQGGLYNERPELVSVLCAGKPASALPGLVSALLAMCGHAHGLASRLAVEAARGQPRSLSSDESRSLQIDTLREHLRRLWLDWPRLLQGHMDASLSQLETLHGAPVLQGKLASVASEHPTTLDATRGWLHAQVFDMPPDIWLARWLRDGEVWLADWCLRSPTAPARLLAAIQPAARATVLPVRALRPSDTPALQALAHRLAADAAQVRHPTWPLSEVETGPWCRLHATWDTTTPRSLWWRMAGRLADLARLALHDQPAHSSADLGPCGHQVLSHGSLVLGPGNGLAWVEMARGTLIHGVQLDGDGPNARVQGCQVLSPTEWNFHPQGPVNHLLSAVPDDARFAAHAALIVAAFDPCVPFTIVGTDDPCTAEPGHA
jgi:hypothetical protein